MKTLKECFITTERPYQEGTVEVFEQTVPAARRATLSITALGVYEARINGKKVGDHYEEISWEQAYKEIAEKANRIIAEHGPRSFSVLGCVLGSAQTPYATA